MSGQFDVYEIRKEALVVGRFTGILDAHAAKQLIDFIETKELLTETGFNRFCDLTHLGGIRLSAVDLIELADRRREFNPNSIPVKSAIFARDPLAFGIARMYEQFLDSPRIEVRVWNSMAAAADWLGVSPESLAL